MNKNLRKDGTGMIFAAAILPVVLLMPGIFGMRAYASDRVLSGAADGGWETQKEAVREAMDELRDLGFSPMDIVENLFGAEEKEDAAGKEALQQEETGSGALPDGIQGLGENLSEKVQETSDALVQEAAEAGSQILEDVQDAAKEQAKNAFERFLDDMKQKFQAWVEDIFD